MSLTLPTFETGSNDHELVKLHFGTPSDAVVYVYEDNAGGLHLWQAGRLYAIGGLSDDGSFSDDAQSLAEGGAIDWNGQACYDANDLDGLINQVNGFVCIACYDPATSNVTTESDRIGNAGRRYLGLERE